MNVNLQKIIIFLVSFLSGIPPAPRGVPQIEVTFDIDANGILNVTAADKTAGKEEKITITNDKGRLSKEDIERMVNDAEEYKKQDEERFKNVEARMDKSYLFNTQSALTDEIKAKLPADELEVVESTIKNAMTWLGLAIKARPLMFTMINKKK